VTGKGARARPLRSVHNAAESNHMTHLHASSASAPHHAIPTSRVLSTPEILQRIQAMYAGHEDPGSADPGRKPSPT